MNDRYKFTATAAAAMAAMAMMFTACDSDDVVEINQGQEITFSTQMSRATEITDASKLRGFYVWADAVGYDQMFINGDEATKDDDKSNSNIFSLPKSYYWPKGIERIRFWAYGPSSDHDEGGLDKNIVKPNMTVNQQSFSDLTPRQSLTEGGKDQRDFLVAYTEIARTAVSGWSVPLNFLHALTQVNVKAKLGEGSDKIVRIKGAWIINAKAKGNLSFKDPTVSGGEAVAQAEGDKIQADAGYMNWTGQDGTASYGVVLPEPELLTSSATDLIGGSDNTSLMLIPQPETKGITFDENGVAAQGAYILLLCRVEAKHPGKLHGGDSGSGNTATGPVWSDGTDHFHQLFPEADTYDPQTYGYTCVSLDLKDWLPGKKVTYTLEFCGKSSGAGLYPPKPGNGFPTDDKVIDRPSGKKEGDHVLNDPIKFEVTVDKWTEASSNKNM